MQLVLGIDEAGRGALAGPVAVGAVLLPTTLSWHDFPDLRDSKKLTPRARERWLDVLASDERLSWTVSFSSAGVIDRHGIVAAANAAATRCAAKLTANVSESGTIQCDAGLCARHEWPQESLVKGDEREVAIALASIVAKVSRDRLMERLCSRHPQYGFSQHKGYGTRAHLTALHAHGLTPKIHRSSFIHLT